MIGLLEVLIWWLAIQVIGLVSTPIVIYICNNLEDKGYSIAKLFGLLLITSLSYILTVLNLFNFGVVVILFSIIIVSITSLFLLLNKNSSKKIIPHLQKASFKRMILLTEIVFTASFLFFTMIISYIPDTNNGEARYDLAYMNTLTRINKFPPPHTWFAGVTLDNYYYFGHLTAAILSLLTGTPTSIAYNLSMGLYFGFTAVTAYGILFNLTKKPTYGILGVIFIVFAGNIISLFQVINYFNPNINWYIIDYHPPTGGTVIQNLVNYNWWTASRIIPWAIHEFPYWTFMWGDLHGHLMIIPVRILLVLLFLNMYKSNKGLFKTFGDSLFSILLGLFGVAVCLGFVPPTNVYDFPFLLLFMLITILIHDYKIAGKFELRVFLKSLFVFFVIVLLSFILYFPIDSQLSQRINLSIVKFLPHEESYPLYTRQAGSIQIETMKTSLYHFLVVFSLPLFLIFSFIIYNFYKLLSKKKKYLVFGTILLIIYFIIFISVFFNYFNREEEFKHSISVSLTLHSLLFDFQLLILLIPLIVITLFLLFKKYKFDIDQEFVLILILIGALITLICELVNIEGRYVFMNKVYGEPFIFWGIVLVYLIYFFSDKFHSLIKINLLNILKVIWFLCVLFLAFSCLIFPFLTTYQKTNGFTPSLGREKPTLDGTDYLKFEHNDDYKAITWINKNIKGVPVILEVPGRSYQHTSRVSVYTGLPTILGWHQHMELHLAVDWKNIWNRSNEADLIYNTVDNEEALKLLKKYNVQYVYIGELEKDYKNIYIGSELDVKNYSVEGLEKFSKHPEYYTLVYNESNVQIYNVTYHN